MNPLRLLALLALALLLRLNMNLLTLTCRLLPPPSPRTGETPPPPREWAFRQDLRNHEVSVGTVVSLQSPPRQPR